MLHVVLRRSLSAAPSRAAQLARPTHALGLAGRSTTGATTTVTQQQLVASLHLESRLAMAKRRFGALLRKEYTPSPLMLRARQLSTEASNAASAAKGGLLQFPKEHPFATNIIIATIKTSLCDILVQKYVEKKEDVDWRRVSVFTAFGCLYLGFFQWAIYVTLFGRLFPGMAKFANMPFKEKIKDTRGMLNVVGQTAFDNFIHYTFIYFPVFYVFKESIQVRHATPYHPPSTNTFPPTHPPTLPRSLERPRPCFSLAGLGTVNRFSFLSCVWLRCTFVGHWLRKDRCFRDGQVARQVPRKLPRGQHEDLDAVDPG